MPLFLHAPKQSMVTGLLLASFALLLFPYSSFADFSGPAVSILDGDTLEVLNGHHAEHIRIISIVRNRDS